MIHRVMDWGFGSRVQGLMSDLSSGFPFAGHLRNFFPTCLYLGCLFRGKMFLQFMGAFATPCCIILLAELVGL